MSNVGQLHGGTQGHTGVCTLYVYGVCNGWGKSGLIELNTLEQFKFDMKINLVNIIRVIQQETSLR